MIPRHAALTLLLLVVTGAVSVLGQEAGETGGTGLAIRVVQEYSSDDVPASPSDISDEVHDILVRLEQRYNEIEGFCANIVLKTLDKVMEEEHEPNVDCERNRMDRVPQGC
jgi:hypothetical protein